MYKSPIEMIVGQMNVEYENGILKYTQSYCPNIDKDELIKALKYDRDQYDKGYVDGVADSPCKWIPCSERLPDCAWGSEVGSFLFQLKSTETMYTGYYGTGGIYRDRYFRTYNNATDGYDVSDVAAWMPLPKPYCEESI